MKKNKTNKKTTKRIASRLTDDERCAILDSILNKSDRKFTDAELDRICELYGDLMAFIG